MFTAMGVSASAFLTFVSAQETVLQPLPATVMPVNQTQTGDVDPNGGASSCLTLSADLRYKMKDAVVGGDVSDLQDFLISTNLMQGESTGYFGAGTLKAVKLFQKKQGLNPTGFVGPLTRAKVNTLSCSPQVPNLGDKPQTERPQRQMGEGPESDTQRGRGEASSTFPGVVNGFPQKRSDDGKQEQDRPKQDSEGRDKNMKQGVPSEISMLSSYLSDTDKATLKAKEDAVKSAEEALKTYYLSVRTGTMTDTVKAKLTSLNDAVIQARKDLDETRKSIFDNLKNNLTDTQKQRLEYMIKSMRGKPQGGDASTTRPEKKEMGDKKGQLGGPLEMRMPPQAAGGRMSDDTKPTQGTVPAGMMPQDFPASQPQVR